MAITSNHPRPTDKTAGIPKPEEPQLFRFSRLAAGLACLLLGLAWTPIALGQEEEVEEVYLDPKVFVAETFDGEAPKPSALWLTEDIKPGIAKILGHDYPAARVRYWRRENRSAWILEEIGKTRPITVGIAIENGKITRLRVLVYRESHGWEVKQDFFTKQFDEAGLTPKLRLSRNIDGISGATLSVNALEKLGALALYFHQAIQPADTPK